MTEVADIVIVGGGSAGCVLAARLSEDPARRVVLLEAGGEDSRLMNRMPAGGMKLLGHAETDWGYVTEPDPSLNGRRGYWNAGRLLGGGSSVNGMVYIRGDRSDYDAWAQLGCTGWSWDDVLPYFRKSEDFSGEPGQAHGKLGPLGVGRPGIRHPLAEVFVDACEEHGLRRVEDYCAGDVDGAFVMYCTQKNGLRSSTSRAFLSKAMKRPNLTALTGATVERIAVEGGRAKAVEFVHGGESKLIHARREVVLAAGALQSPAVLIRSGIGPSEHLRSLGVPVVRDAPDVGRNLQEHASFSSSFAVNVATYNTMMKPLRLSLEMVRFLALRRGLMTMIPVEAMAFLRSRPDLERPDLKLSFGAMCSNPKTRKPHERPGVIVYMNVAKPKSRGEIRLRSASALEKPVIDHRLIGHPDDMAALVAGAKQVQAIFAGKAFAPYLVDRIAPDPAPSSDDEWEQQIRDTSGIGYHPVGSCRMGADPDSVVDPALRVRGVAGLRVADASVMPVMPSANTNAPTIMIAEKAADLIAAKHR